jgi:hypothetical protein
MSPPPRPSRSVKHFTMLREFHVADFLTLGNAACGVAAVLLALRYMQSAAPVHFFAAAAMAPAAFVFDFLDGRVARWRREHSALGREQALYFGAWSIGPWTLHPLVLLFVLSGTLMVSTSLRIPKI